MTLGLQTESGILSFPNHLFFGVPCPLSKSLKDSIALERIDTPTDDPQELKEMARRIRLHALRMTSNGKSSHIASCFSIADILAALYGSVMELSAENPKDPARDRFILSKGHAGAAVYAALAERGFFSRELLEQHYQDGSLLCGHVSHKGIPGVEISTGSLGQGLSIGTGIALNGSLTGADYRTFVLLSDGECDEGSVWEAALFAAHHKLDNLNVIIDYNKIQSLDTVANTIGLEPFRGKWEHFGWQVHEVDGHDVEQLIKTCEHIQSHRDNRPQCIIAHTVKGKGVSFMEESVLWHYRTAQGKEFQAALEELQ